MRNARGVPAFGVKWAQLAALRLVRPCIQRHRDSFPANKSAGVESKRKQAGDAVHFCAGGAHNSGKPICLRILRVSALI